jgi:hypothetical protein
MAGWEPVTVASDAERGHLERSGPMPIIRPGAGARCRLLPRMRSTRHRRRPRSNVPPPATCAASSTETAGFAFRSIRSRRRGVGGSQLLVPLAPPGYLSAAEVGVQPVEEGIAAGAETVGVPGAEPTVGEDQDGDPATARSTKGPHRDRLDYQHSGSGRHQFIIIRQVPCAGLRRSRRRLSPSRVDRRSSLPLLLRLRRPGVRRPWSRHLSSRSAPPC